MNSFADSNDKLCLTCGGPIYGLHICDGGNALGSLVGTASAFSHLYAGENEQFLLREYYSMASVRFVYMFVYIYIYIFIYMFVRYRLLSRLTIRAKN